MNRCVIMAMMLMSALAFAQEGFAQATPSKKADSQKSATAKISLAEARGRIDAVIASPETMAETMKQLSAEDQVAFLADVNKAVGSMPGSAQEKSSLFVSLNLAAVANAEKGNSATLIAESFATVSPESLPALAEHFASDLLSRTADPNVVISDAQYEKIALNTMEKINERCETTDNGSPRVAFAILMFLRASGGTSESLMEHLVDTMKHADAKELAAKEWIPAALGTGGTESNYEPLLAAADAGLRSDRDATLVIAGPQHGVAVLADLSGKNSEADLFSQTMTPVLDAIENSLVQQSPNIGNDKVGAAGANGGAVHGGVIEAGELDGGDKDTRPNPTNPDPQGTGHSPVPYSNQTMK